MEFNKDKIIYGILEINNKTAYGTKNEKRFYPYDKSLPMFYVPTKKPFSPINLYCGIKFDKKVKDNYFGTIEKYIGELGNIDAEIDYLKHIACANWKGNSKLKLDEYNVDLTPDRINLTELNTYSIDPNGCVDIDDALSININENGNTEIYIHIADVSSFIGVDSELDKEIKNRSESVYLNKYQVNMIPDKLSIDKISLKQPENRAFTLKLELDSNYNIVNYNYFKSIVKVKNLSYNECDKLINKNPDIEKLFNIGKVLYKNKFGNITEDYNSHHMVEIFMIIANTISAKNIKDFTGAIFRKQEHIDSISMLDWKPAEYTYLDKDVKHSSLGEDLYTHFTSPMRRYVDIIVHRILSNKYCGTSFIIDDNTDYINNLNKTNKLIKKINRTGGLYSNIFSDDFSECSEYNGTIIGFKNNKVYVFVKQIGIIPIKLFDKKMADLFSINITDSYLELFDKENNKNSNYTINHEVQIKIAITKLSDKKINANFI